MDKLLVNNSTAKIVAIVVACLLWLYVMNEQNPPIDASYTVPVVQKNLDTNFVAFNSPDIAKVKLRGPRSYIAGVSSDDIRCFVDFKNMNEGNNEVKVQAQIPATLELLEVSPSKVTVKLDPIVSRELPPKVLTTGVLSTHVLIVETSAKPDKIVLNGPKSYMAKIVQVAAFVNVTDKTEDIVRRVELKALDGNGKNIEGIVINPARADINIKILPKQDKLTADVKTIIYGDLPDGYSIQSIRTEPAKIEISGPVETVKKVSYVFTEPIDMGKVRENTTIESKLQLPAGVQSNTEKVTVKIVVKKNDV